jgi:hypothetical protein
MNKKYVVRLSDDERAFCQEIIKNLKGSSQKFRRAQMLLKADADGPGWPDVRIADAFNCRAQTLENLRKRLVTEGFEGTLEGKKRRDPPTPCKLDGEAEAKLIAMRLGKPPATVESNRCPSAPPLSRYLRRCSATQSGGLPASSKSRIP